MRHPDGQYRWLRIHGLCSRDAEGKPVRMAGSTSDIDARKRAEEALRTSEEQYRAIFNAAADAFVLRDANARVIDVNPAFLEISGYTREEVLEGKRWIFALPEMSDAREGDAPARDRGRVGAIRDQGAAQGRHAARHRDARGADPLPRPAARARHGARHHRAQAGGGRARAPRGPAAAVEEAGGDRHPRRRHRARLQQHPRRDPRLRRDGAEEGAARARRCAGTSTRWSPPACAPSRWSRASSPSAAAASASACRCMCSRWSRRRSTCSRLRCPPTCGSSASSRAATPRVMGDATQIHQVVMNLCANAAQAMRPEGGWTVSLDVVERSDEHGRDQPPRRRALRAPARARHRQRHRAAGARAHLRSVLHHARSRRRHRPGPVAGARHRHRARRRHRRRQQAGRRRAPSASTCPGATSWRPSGNWTRPRRWGAARPSCSSTTRNRSCAWARRCSPRSATSRSASPRARAALAAFRADPDRFDVVLSDEAMPDLTGADLARAIRAIRPDMPVVLMSGYVSPLFARARAISAWWRCCRKPLVARDIARCLADALRSRHAA